MNKYKKRRMIALLIIAIAIISFKGIGKAEEKTIVESYVVKSGDTLWSIAAENKGDEYILDYMDDLKNLNKSSLEQLSIGQEIQILKKGEN